MAFCVGSILNVINQYDAIFGSATIHGPKFCLTYAVPYFVSSLTAWFDRKS